MRKKRHLSIEEKRDWLAYVFRDESGEFSQADKFKAMTEDTRLAVLQAEQKAAEQPAAAPAAPLPDILDFLPPPLPPSESG
ncbi:MAG: hypothetical protein IKV82_09020 [Akkermansia sp.]|nr:hypothetical protein [Akkermansia sp.]